MGSRWTRVSAKSAARPSQTVPGGPSAIRFRRDRCRRRRRRGNLCLCVCSSGQVGPGPRAGRTRIWPTSPSHDEKAMLIDKRPYDDREVDVNGTAKRLYMGGILGGGTSLYGGALVRPSEQDFQPGRYYGKRIPRAIWDWPISYADLEPYYTEAERLYGVAGRGEEDFSPAAETLPRAIRATLCRCIRSTRGSSPPIAFTACIPFVCRWRSTPRAACAAAFARATSVPTGARSSVGPVARASHRRRTIPSRSKRKSKSSDWSRNAVAERR